LGKSVNALATQLRVPSTRLHGIVNERRAMTPDTALRLTRYFGGSAQFWMNLQSAHDLQREDIAHGDEIERSISAR